MTDNDMLAASISAALLFLQRPQERDELFSFLRCQLEAKFMTFDCPALRARRAPHRERACP
jgi:hypothetical protein